MATLLSTGTDARAAAGTYTTVLLPLGKYFISGWQITFRFYVDAGGNAGISWSFLTGITPFSSNAYTTEVFPAGKAYGVVVNSPGLGGGLMLFPAATLSSRHIINAPATFSIIDYAIYGDLIS